tara:strand:+ start:21 stop:218 length:198 start_codon:yes stop_codon:yes gene_type:complete
MNLQAQMTKKLEQSGLSQRDVAKLTGLSQQAISKIVNGQTKEPDYKTAVRLAKFLKTNIRNIYDE